MLGATIVARSRLPHARVLGSSFLHHHPAASFVVLVLDGAEDNSANDGLEFLTPDTLGLGPGVWERLAASYEEDELASALKPFLLGHLLTRGRDGEPAPTAFLMDPEIRVYGKLDQAFRLAERHGIALVPRVLGALPDDGDRPTEHDLARAGLFNDGVLCVGPAAGAFLAQWSGRVVSVAWGGRRADQLWLSWAPTTFGARAITDPGCGVSYWNLWERPLSHNRKGTLLAGDRALRLIDFSGYEPETPWVLSQAASAGSRVMPIEAPVLAHELDRYAADLRAAGAENGHRDYGLEYTPDGIRLDPLVRRAYRHANVEADRTGSQPPASPFAAGRGDDFADWLTAPVMGPASLRLGPLERELWKQRPDLQARFPEPASSDAWSYRTWLDTDPGAITLLSNALPPHTAVGLAHPLAAARAEPSEGARRFGWNVLGQLTADSELGEATRRIADAFEQAAVLTQRVTVPRARDAMTVPVADELEMTNSLLCVRADELARALALGSTAEAVRAGDLPSGRGRSVLLWFWELSRLPSGNVALPQVDEIWCPSQFVADAVSARVQIPVKVVPLPARTSVGPTRLTRQKLGLPDGFVFYFSYEFGAALARKNPLGLIDAYCRAFGPSDGVSLVLRSSDGPHHYDQLAQVRWAARGRRDIHVIDRTLDAVAAQGMIELTDCFVSLHRAEAFGINMATAMAAARPVIATAYSGNLDFMDERSAYLVPYALRPVGEGCAPYPATAVWAKPDLNVAAQRMREVFEDPARAAEVGLRAAQRVLRTHGLWQSATAIAREVGITLPRKTSPSA